jgi:hypothetical protein
MMLLYTNLRKQFDEQFPFLSWLQARVKHSPKLLPLVTPLRSFYRTNGFLVVGLDCYTILLNIEVESSGLSARTVFLPK